MRQTNARGMWHVAVLALGVACAGGSEPTAFGSGGSKGEEPGYSDEDTTSDSASAPGISRIEVGSVEVDGAPGWTFEIHFSDLEDDLDGGVLDVEIVGDGGDERALSAEIGSGEDGVLTADLAEDGSHVEAALAPVEADQFYDVSIALTDAAGNRGTVWDITAYGQW